MNSDNIKNKRYKICTVVGSIFLLICNGQVYSWGNNAAYISSYFFTHQKEADLERKIPWVLSCFLIFRSIGVTIYPLLMKLTGKRYSAVVGLVISDLAILASYFSVQRSFLAFALTFGSCTGLGNGLLYACSMRLMVSWADNDMGFLIAIVQSSFPLGAIGINEFVTSYLNPSDLLPNVRFGNVEYFTQSDVLDKIPSIFLILSGVSLILHLLGFVFVKENTSCKDDRGRSKVSLKASYSTFDSYCDRTNIPSRQKAAQSSETNEGTTLTNPSSEMKPVDSNSNNDRTSETLQKIPFLAAWVAMIMCEFSQLPLLNYNKIFGQIWIHDDRFLTNLITVMLVVNIFMRGFGGLCIDKFGPKVCLCIINVISTLILMWYYFFARVDKWLYLAANVLYGVCPSGFYICYPCIVANLFGKKHFTSNYAYMKTATLVANISGPWIMGFILSQCGWFFLFTSGAISSLISSLILFSFLCLGV